MPDTRRLTPAQRALIVEQLGRALAERWRRDGELPRLNTADSTQNGQQARKPRKAAA